MRYIELFAGIGGFRYGLESVRPAGKNKKENSLGRDSTNFEEGSTWEPTYRCVYANEWDKYAAQIYEKHYEKPDTRDIREVKEVPDHDLLTAGFPCQAFSVAGKRGGFEDTRGTLFFEIARIAKQKQPRLLLLENVKGLLSHDKGKTFGTILNTLDELGYDCQWQVLNSKDFGVPQNRERVFIVGHLRGTSRPQVFPIGEGYGEDNARGKLRTRRKLSQRDKRGAIQEKEKKADSHALRWVRTDKGKKARKEAVRGGRDYTPFNKGHRELVDSTDNISGCITGALNKDALLREGFKVRRLTPTECERLQGFPDGWTEGISDTQRYKCLGNAVTTSVITSIGERLI